MKRSASVVVVTGASSGVGRATVRAFAARGADVGLMARGHDGLQAAAKEVEAAGQRALVLPVDVADPDAVEAAAQHVEDELGPIDVWVNAAMTAVLASVTDTDAREFRRVTEVTYLGSVHGTLAALRRMRPRVRGVIVQVSSALAHRSIPLQASYCAAKHATKGFIEALRCELLHDGGKVRVAMVHLPGLNTPQFSQVRTKMPENRGPYPPVYQPEVAACAIVGVAERPRREVFMGAVTLATVWAGRLFPGVTDRYLARTNYQAQQTDHPSLPGRPSYLWEPLPGDPGAHGAFDSEAHTRSVQLELTTRRRAVAAATLGGAAAVMALRLSRRR